MGHLGKERMNSCPAISERKLGHFRLWLLAAIFSIPLFVVTARGEGYKAEQIVPVHLQDRTRYVCNPDGILAQAAVARMDSLLYALESKTGIEVLVVAVQQIDGGDCFEFAYELGKRNGVGKKKENNGLVIVLSTNDRCIQFVTGYGLEGILPDALCKRIQERKMNPRFAKGEWDTGMVDGLFALNGYLDGSMTADEEEEDEGELTAVAVGFLVMIACLIGIGYALSREKKKCPRCKRYTLKRTGTQLISGKGGRKQRQTVYTCTHCGHTVVRDENPDDDDPSGGFRRRGMGGPIIFGSGLGHGGGFTGGHFGGGSFGGGGAGSRF